MLAINKMLGDDKGRGQHHKTCEGVLKLMMDSDMDQLRIATKYCREEERDGNAVGVGVCKHVVGASPRC